MTRAVEPDLRAIGLGWNESGQASLTGPLLTSANALDAAFTQFAALWAAQAEQHPATVSAAALDELGYLRSFPQQATYAVPLDADEANIEAFRDGPVIADGQVQPTRLAPITAVLTPAACYHVFLGHRGEELGTATYLTTRNTCFRRESSYRPLRRQFSFTMREIVCLGTPSEVAHYTDRVTTLVGKFASRIGVPISWEHASDPFFRPGSDPRSLLQRIQPSKREAVFGDLALGSINNHYEHFGELMEISREGRPASSACMAFGIERWLAAVIETHGDTPASWPDVTAAAHAICQEGA